MVNLVITQIQIEVIHREFISLQDLVCVTEYHSYLVTCLDKTTGDNKWMRYFRSRTPWAISVYDKATQKIIDRMYRQNMKHVWENNGCTLPANTVQFKFWVMIDWYIYFQIAVKIWSVIISVSIHLAAGNVSVNLGISWRMTKSRVEVTG